MSKEVHRIYFCKDGAILDTQIREGEDVTDTLKRCFKKISNLEVKLAESENKLNKYPYKNDVIEEQYEELKNGIKFRIENNITDDWEQHYHCIDVLCEKHKARIRDIENGICKIEELEKLLNAKEKMKTQSLKGFEKLKQQLAEKDKAIENWQTMYESVVKTCHNDKEEIERLNKQLADMDQEQIVEMKEHQEAMELADKTITNLVEDNRASQEWYKKQLKEKDNAIDNLNKQFLKDIENVKKWWIYQYEGGVERENQGKISFAVEQLEKVKEFVKENESWEIEGSDYSIVYADDVLVRIDNQIEELKKEMK